MRLIRRANPFRQHIGLGASRVIDVLEVFWPVTGKTQVFENVAVDKSYEITEDKPALRPLPLPK